MSNAWLLSFAPEKKYLFEQNKKVESFHCTYAIIKIFISLGQKKKVKKVKCLNVEIDLNLQTRKI